MLTLNPSFFINEILEVKAGLLFKTNAAPQNVISGRFRQLKVVIKAVSKIKKDLKLREYLHPQLDLSSKMEYYAELSYLAEDFRNDMKTFLLSQPAMSLFDLLFKHYATKCIKTLDKSEQKVFKLTYPDSKGLNNPDYVAQLNKDYANAPQFSK